jgi:predicted alpha/beta-hydrolase family hydrolase
VRGLFFLGFPLHPADAPDTARGRHLGDVGLPMLFVQGTRDRLADPALLGPIVRALGPRATLHEVVGADHGFAVPRTNGRSPTEVLGDLADVVAGWAP